MIERSGSEGALATMAAGDDPAEDGDAGTAASTAGPASDDRRDERRRRWPTVVGVTAVLAVPIVIALIAVRTPPWYPLVDLAQIEMRVRDVGTSHPPMTGLGGRIFGLDTQGSHPGPLSFYMLAPIYRLAGSSPWSFQLSAAVLNVGVIAAGVWAVHRRWGLRGTLLFAAGLALLMRMYGTVILLYPWNPYLPVLFWMLLLVCVWGVLCGDVALLPVAVLAGSLCAQTHLPYVGLVGGVLAVAAVGLVVQFARARRDPAAAGPTRRRLLLWTGGSVALGFVLWAPVVVEQVGGNPGNVSVIVDSLRDPRDPAVGVGTAWAQLTRHLDVAALLEADRQHPASPWAGGALLAAWAVAAAVAVAVRRLRDRTLLMLHAVVLAALVLGLISISRINGITWFYLMLWAYGTAVLALVAVAATLGLAASGFLVGADDGDRSARGLAVLDRIRSLGPLDRLGGSAWIGRAPVAALAVAVVLPTALLARAAPDTADTDADASTQLGAVIPATVEAVEDGTVAGGGEGTYLVSWVDPIYLGGQGLGLLLELERRGYDARASEPARLGVRDHRVATPAEVDAEIHVAVGQGAIEQARARPGSVEIAYDNPRSDEDNERYAELRRQVIDELVAAGLDDLVPQVDNNIVDLAADERLPRGAVAPLFAMGAMLQPLAVFTWEPGP